MKLVSFKAAKAIKEAGYPQDIYNNEFYYAENGLIWVYDSETYETLDDAICCACPYVLEVWLWLWREKGIKISHRIGVNIIGIEDNDVIEDSFDDPEEAIIAAIEYLVKNDLIK